MLDIILVLLGIFAIANTIAWIGQYKFDKAQIEINKIQEILNGKNFSDGT